MNQRASTALTSVPTLVEPSTAPTPNDGVAKPKVMRRPAQFSKPAARLEPALTSDTRIEAEVPSAPTGAPHAPSLRPWQDDARFAVALLTIIMLFNLALSVWLAPKPSVSIAASSATIAAKNPVPEPAISAPESLIYHLNAAGASVTEH